MKLHGGELFCGSCFDPNTGLPALESKSVDHVITDPPYEEHVHSAQRLAMDGGKLGGATPFGFDAITEEDRARAAHEFVRISRGWIIVFCAIEGVGAWQSALVAAGAKRRNACVWVKTVSTPKFSGNGPAAAYEAMVTAWAGEGDSVWNGGGRYGVYSCPVDRRDRVHPTQKPLHLMEQLILDFTRPGELVLDAYFGSGRTLIAAKKFGRKYAGYEMESKYVVAARAALAAQGEQTRMETLMHHRPRKDSAYAEGGSVKAKQIGLLDAPARSVAFEDDFE